MTAIEQRKGEARNKEFDVSGVDEQSMQLETLYAALDNVESGMLILNSCLRAVYCNSAILKIFHSHRTPAMLREQKPHYRELLEEAAQIREGRRLHYDRSAPALSSVEMEDYVARRLEWVRSGDSKPVDLRMNNGTILRCKLSVLPEGGRMLVYSEITDIVDHARELGRLATTDGMTGICNRRHFLTLANREWVRALRCNTPLTLMVLDIDNFKAINDRFGHQIGDEVIIHLANLANHAKREIDVIARIGGEEFALLVPQTAAHEAQIMAERLRKQVSETPLSARHANIASTISIGVAERSDEMVSFSQLMNAADMALYEAKRSGRDRVVCATASMGDGRKKAKPSGCNEPFIEAESIV